MSGYLARLAARAGGLPAAVAPRSPARFEPVDDPGPTAQSHAQGVAPVPPAGADHDGLGSRRHPRHPRGAERTGRAEPSVAFEPSVASEPSGALGTSDPREPAAHAAAARAGRSVADERSPLAPHPAPRARRAAADPSMDATASSALAASSPAHVGSPTAHRTTTSPAPAPPPSSRDPHADRAPAPPRRAAASPRPRPVPATEGPSAAEVTARDRAERVARPDVVHVTIDRVEIRATLAPPAPAAPDAAAVREPPVPLHDYLAGRSR